MNQYSSFVISHIGIVLFAIFFTYSECQTSSQAPVVVEATTADPLSSVIETPDFLKAATDSQRKEFIELETNPNLPLDVKSQAMTNWAKRCGEPVNSLYNAYVSEKQLLENQENARMSQIVSQLSPEAQTADKDVREITSDKNQTKKEMDAKVTKQLKTLPKKVYYELTFATQ